MEHCCHILAGAPSCYLELLDKLQRRMCRTVSSSLATSLGLPLSTTLTHRQNVASLSLFYRYFFGRCSSELAQLVLLPFSRGRSTRYSDRLCEFCVAIPRCCKDVYVRSFFPHTARLGRSIRYSDRLCEFCVTIPICYKDVYVRSFFPRPARLRNSLPLTYDLNGFKCRINRHLLTVGSF